MATEDEFLLDNLLLNDDSHHDAVNSSQSLSPRSRSRYLWLVCRVLVVAICFAAAVFMGPVLYDIYSTHDRSQSPMDCINPKQRREWRTLSKAEKQEYIAAVQCLRDVPSLFGLNQTLYDDFPWAHTYLGSDAHESTPFLAWHRYFIHIYEKALQERCRYRGQLVYWNWELDWQDLAQAPVWDNETGFGGDGDLFQKPTVGWGHCVKDGPFAGLIALFYGREDKPHCLSRRFQRGSQMEELFSARVRLETLKTLLNMPDYNSFNLGLEHGPHLAVPHGVLGDILVDSAPYDPIFFLHHTQLDRLWWIWQRADPEKRLMEYNGNRSASSQDEARSGDLLSMGKLAPTIAVSDVLNTESGLLCYHY